MTTAESAENDARIILGNCILGRNLNLLSVRGFADIRTLASISKPDIFDSITNTLGTQRDLAATHAREATEYAEGALLVLSQEDPRAFTEVILNVRDQKAVRVVDSATGEVIHLDSHSNAVHPARVELVVDREYLEGAHHIAIARVDGNHRLSLLGETPEEAANPLVPFAIFLGLSDTQERKLFRDINGTTKKMETAHLANIEHMLQGDDLLQETEGRALWFAKRLADQGMPFYLKVHMGGSKKGTREIGGATAPLSLNGLQSCVRHTLAASKQDLVWFGSAVDRSNKDAWNETLKNATLYCKLLERFWNAVGKAYPQGWSDKKSYIVLQTIGLNALGQIAGYVIDELLAQDKVTQKDFDFVLQYLASKVPMDKHRVEFEGKAGAAGTKSVAAMLAKELNWPELNAWSAAQKLAQDSGYGNKLEEPNYS